MFTPQSRLEYLAELTNAQLDQGVANGEITQGELADLYNYFAGAGVDLATLPAVVVTAQRDNSRLWYIAAGLLAAVLVLGDARGR